MKNYKIILVFISSIFFGNLAFSSEGIAVIDYNAIFLGTELARERIDDLRDSSDYKELTDEAQSKDSERIKLAEKLKKEESTLSESEKADILKGSNPISKHSVIITTDSSQGARSHSKASSRSSGNSTKSR